MNRIYTFLGQYGIGGTLLDLAQRLSVFGKSTVHAWDDTGPAIEARGLPQATKLIAIGFSLGASTAATDFPNAVKRDVALVVAYDPSRLSPDAPGGIEPVRANVKRAICYWSPYSVYYGGAYLTGPQVVRYRVADYLSWTHVAIAYYSSLHNITYAEVQKACR